MKFGVYISLENGELFTISQMMWDCYIVWYGSSEVSAVKKQDLENANVEFLSEL